MAGNRWGAPRFLPAKEPRSRSQPLTLPTDILELVFRLLPGFVTAWVLYGLTPYRTPNTFERVVQALIFTAFIEAVLWILRSVLFAAGALMLEPWPWLSSAELPRSVLIALLLGLIFAWAANNPVFHRKLWKWEITSSNGFASEWFATFRVEKRFVILNLTDGRRIYGWPREWPDHALEGHFVLSHAEWLVAGEPGGPDANIDLPEVRKIVIPASLVEIVEFMKAEGEDDAADELEKMESRLHARLSNVPGAFQRCWRWLWRPRMDKSRNPAGAAPPAAPPEQQPGADDADRDRSQ